MLCYRVSPIASHLFFALITGVVIMFCFKSGKLRFPRWLAKNVKLVEP